MYIERLAVENFRRFEANAWTFSPGFNVLIGNNGAGKSTVLDAVAIALDPLIFKSAGTPGRAIRADDIRRARNESQFPVIIDVIGQYLGENHTWRRTLSEKPNSKTVNHAKSAGAPRVFSPPCAEAIRSWLPLSPTLRRADSGVKSGKSWTIPSRRDQSCVVTITAWTPKRTTAFFFAGSKPCSSPRCRSLCWHGILPVLTLFCK